MTPRRIRLSRSKGFRLADASDNPNGVVRVDRSTRWENPFVPILETGTGVWRITFKVPATEISPATTVLLAGHTHTWRHVAFEDAVQLYRLQWEYHARDLDVPVQDLLAELRGKDLACWCPEHDPCHASVLIELSNAARPAEAS
jgi:hypothetical protein